MLEIMRDTCVRGILAPAFTTTAPNILGWLWSSFNHTVKSLLNLCSVPVENLRLTTEISWNPFKFILFHKDTFFNWINTLTFTSNLNKRANLT